MQPEFVEQVRRRQTRDQTAQLKASFAELIRAARPIEEIAARIEMLRREAQLDDTTTLFLIWDAIFGAIEWSARSQQVWALSVGGVRARALVVKFVWHVAYYRPNTCRTQAPEQAVRQLQQFAGLLKPFVTTPTAQTDLLVKVQVGAEGRPGARGATHGRNHIVHRLYH